MCSSDLDGVVLGSDAARSPGRTVDAYDATKSIGYDALITADAITTNAITTNAAITVATSIATAAVDVPAITVQSAAAVSRIIINDLSFKTIICTFAGSHRSHISTEN